MRFDKSKVDPGRLQDPSRLEGLGCCDGHHCQGGGGEVEDLPYCVPADGLRRKGCAWDEGAQACFRNDCDALFTPRPLRERQRGWEVEGGRPKLLVAAGPERSGSTWLYNCVRMLFEQAEQPLDAYWLKQITNAALDVRGAGRLDTHHVLIKTHAWSQDWDVGRASHIFITHRDLRQVVRSYRRLGWEEDLPAGYVQDHLRWRASGRPAEQAEADLAFEDIVSRPHVLVEDLATRLGLLDKVDVGQVVEALNNLPVPTDWVDPVTQIWPSHISTPYMEERRLVTSGGLATKQNGAPGSSEAGPQAPAAPGPNTPRPGGSRPQAHSDLDAFDYLKRQHHAFFELYGYE